MTSTKKNVLLTGATGGIGSCTADVLARSGAALLLSARDETQLLRLRDRLSTTGTHIEYVAADIASDQGRTRIVNAARTFRDGIDVLVNNAAINDFSAFEHQSAGEIAEIMNTNAIAPMLLTRELLPELRSRDQAAIVNVGSIIGSIGLPGQAAYCSSKFALHGFSEALRRELRGCGIDVVYVAPRTTDTALNDAELCEHNRRLGVAVDDPRHVAERIVEALFERRREQFIGWPERLFVKLNALLPGIIDRSVAKQADLSSQNLATGRMPATPEGVKQ